MDRSQSQQQQPRRPKNNDSFRPALRFPTDPHKPESLPSRLQHIVAPAPAAILLQSRRKPWEVDTTRLDDLIAATASTRKVIVVLGDPPSSALEPIVSSSYLSGSLVIVIASSESDLSLSPQQCVPAIRILRLRPKPAVNPTPQQQQQRAGSDVPAEPSHLNAARLNSVLDWADRVGSAWRANPVGQAMFATLQEGEGPADGIGGNGKPWKWKSKTKLSSTSATYTTVYDVSDGDGSLVPWAARFALNSRSNSSSLASGSSNTSSIFIVETPGSETNARPSFSSSTGGKFVRNAMSTSNLGQGDSSFDNSVGRRNGTSHAGHRSVPPPSKGLDAPAHQKRRFSLISFAKGKMSPDLPSTGHSGSTAKKSIRPSFDAVINFLPPSSATGLDGALGRGAIATNHAVAAHNKLLLKQTILVTTATQRFLVPVPHRGSGRSPGEGRFGGVTRSRTNTTVERNGSDDRQAKKRWSVALIGSLFGVGDHHQQQSQVPSAKALGKRSVLPTPPGSRPSSSEESGHAQKRPSLGGRMMSSVSAVSASTQGPWPLPKLVHVLPYGPGHAATPAGVASARLVRNLEAFLLSWSFGGPRFGAEDTDDSGAEGPAVPFGGKGKRTVRPFLLDLAGMTDVLKAQFPEGDVDWPLVDLIMSGALDDEYPCTGGSLDMSPSSSVPTPDVVVTRASSDARSPTNPNFPSHSRTPSNSYNKPKYGGHDGLTLDSTPGPAMLMEETWAARRAWLGGVGDLAIFPTPESGAGLGLLASSTSSSPVVPPSAFAMGGERSRTRSLGGPVGASGSGAGSAVVGRPRVSIGGVHSASSSPAPSPLTQSPPPPVPSKSPGPISPPRLVGSASPASSFNPTSPARSVNPTSPARVVNPTSPARAVNPATPIRPLGPTSPAKSFGPTSPISTGGKTVHPAPRLVNHSRSQSSSNQNTPPVPPLPASFSPVSPQHETFHSPPQRETSFHSPPPPSGSLRTTNGNNFRTNSAEQQDQPRYTRNPVPRPPQQSSLDAEDRPKYYSVSDHGHGGSSRTPTTPMTPPAELRRGKSAAASPLASSTPIAAAFSRSNRDVEEFAPPPTSWHAGTWGSSSSGPSFQQPQTPSSTLPSRSSNRNPEYSSQANTPRTPSRGMTVPQSGGSWDPDSPSVVSRPSVLRKKSIDERDRRYGSDPPPGPHPLFASSPKYPGIGRRPSEENQSYFNGYEIAPPPLPTPPPPRPSRDSRPPNVLNKDGRNRSTSSPLRHGVSAEGLTNHRSRPGTGGSVMDKHLPITPPDSASSSEVSNDMDMGGRTSDREDSKRKWWGTPNRVSARLI